MSEEPNPVKADSHVLDTKVDLYLAPCLCAHCLEEWFLNYCHCQG